MVQAAALFDTGNALFARGETEAAINAFQRCHALMPNHAGVLFNLGNALRQAGRPVDAVPMFVLCLQAAPGFGAAYVNLADTLRRLTLLTQAQEMAELGVRHMPHEPEAIMCLANVLHEKADYAAATTLYRQALIRAPGHAGLLSSLGNTLRAMGRLPEALTLHAKAVAAEPDTADFHLNRGLALLTAGDFAAGWDEYEWRWRQANNPPRDFGPVWQGEDITGRTILLHAEQGLGDTLQFVRYVPLVAERGAHVILEVQPPLVRLLQRMPGRAHVVARGDALPPFDTHCPLLSLPRAFATRLDTIPSRLPYLHADPVAATAWSARLPAGDGLPVGLVWAGSPHPEDAGAHLIDQRRSIKLRALAPLFAIDGVRWISLQKDPADPPPAGLTLFDPMPEVTDFADTAAVAVNLDLVIAVDTAVAHLAGGLGRPVWLLSRYDGCWRWLNGRTDTPWHPRMRIYQQERPHDWSSVVARIASDLKQRLGRR